MNIYVGNLSYNSTEEELLKTFEKYGEVMSVKIISDRYSGQSKGFGFVEMPQQSQAIEAIKALNGFSYKGRDLKVNEAKPKDNKSRRRHR